jgi:autotransporter-associated beta strand protein
MKTPPLARSPRLAILAAISTGIVTTVSLHAQIDQTWSGTVNNNWNTTELNWDSGAAAWTNNNNAIFGGTAATVTVNEADITFNDLTFNSGYTIAASGAGSLKLANDAASTVTVAASTTASISAGIADGTGGASALTKAGTGTLILSGANTYTGATTISAGTMEFQGASSMSTGSALSMSTGTTLSLKADADTTFIPASLGAFSPNSTYNLQVNSLNSPAGDGHTLTLNGQTATSTGNNTQTVTINVTSTTGDTLKFGASATYQLSGGSGSAFGGNSNTFNLNGANVILNGLSNSTTNGDVFLTLNSTSASNSLTINGVVANNGSRTIGAVVNSGVLTLNNTISNPGGANNGFWVTLNGGTLNVNNAAAISNNNLTAHGNNGFRIAGGTLDNTSGSAVTLNTNASMGIGIDGNFAFSTAGGTSANDLSLGTNAVTLGTPAGTSRTITTNGSATLTIGGVISNGTTANSIVKAGTGTLKLTGTNAYTGATTVNGGTLKVNGSIATSSGVTINGSGATLAGTGTVSGITLTSGTITPGDGGIGTLTASSLDWAGGNNLTFDLSGVDSTADLLSLSGSLTKSGSGTYAFDFSGGLAGQTYTLIDFGSNSGFSVGDFSVNSGISGTFGLSGTSLTFTAVPEPQECALAIVGLLGVMIFVRRRVAHFGE